MPPAEAYRHSGRILRGLLVVATALVVAASATAKPLELGVNGNGGDTSGTAVVTDVFDRAVIPQSTNVAAQPDAFSSQATTVRPDVKAGARGVGAASATSVRPDDRAGERGPGTIQQPEVTLLSDNGSEWTNYLIGAAGGLGASLLLMGGLAVALHFRRRHGPIALP